MSRSAERSRFPLAEVLMFGFLAVIVIIGGIAAYAHFSPRFQKVPNRVEEGFKSDRINLLLIGIGGDTHPGEGKDLADALMVVSLKPSTRQVALVSLPRDLYLKMDTFGEHRLNAAHALGGPAYQMQIVSKVTGEPVHAYARIDFRAFEKVIDTLGGIDIHVYRPFYDQLFKDGFASGRQHMNGQRALRYARYRYVENSPEGNDFGRELRQQQVLEAIKEKIAHLPPNDVLRLVKIARAVGDHTDTNLTATQIADLYSIFGRTKRADIRNVSLKKYMEIFMVHTPGDSGDAVRPPNDDYTAIHRVVDRVFAAREPILARDEIPMTQ